MHTPPVTCISARYNPAIKTLRQLAQQPSAYRRSGHIWIEGDHLCRAALQRGLLPDWAVFSHSFWHSGQVQPQWWQGAQRVLVLDDALLAHISALESAPHMGYLLPATQVQQPIQAGVRTVVLDRLQDPGNVGSILRSASAMGFAQILALPGTTALWSPKVLRAGMGAHFGLQLHENTTLADIDALGVPLLVTHLKGQQLLHHSPLPHPCAWVLGHEGQGVADALVQRAHLLLRIAQPGGEESLNVAAAAAICLHASAVAALPPPSVP